jgi:hypothetical protein
MFQKLGGYYGYYGFFILAGLNLLFFVLIYPFLPETSGRSREAIDLLLEPDEWWNRVMEGNYRKKRGKLVDEESEERAFSDASESKYSDAGTERPEGLEEVMGWKS